MPPEAPVELRFTAVVQELAETPADSDGSKPKLRSMRSRLVSYGTVITPQSMWGGAVRLTTDALDVPEDLNDIKLLREHDPARVIGAMTEFEADAEGSFGVFRFARTQDADEAFALAEDQILNAVSVGFRVHDYRFVTEDELEIMEVSRASLFEVSMVGRPADTTARIDAVTARKAPAMTTPVAVPPQSTEPAPALSADQLDQVLAAVTSRMAPPAAAPVAAPGIISARLVDGDGNPIVLAHDRLDPRIPAALGNNGKRYTAGDYFAAYAAGVNAGDWTRHNEIRAALADELTSDIPGLLPKAIVGELLGRASGRRPLWDSLTARDMPMAGESFSRPMITQHVKVDPQSAQKTEVASQKYTVALNPVSKSTLAGALDVSQQALDWSSPSLLNELIIDFTRIYIARTDKFAATNLVAAATAGAQKVTWDGEAATLTKALADAAVLVYNGVSPEVDVFPNTIWISVDVWAQLAGLTDTSDRPLLPQLGANNATGMIDLTNPEAGVLQSGFRWVVDKNLPAKTFIMGDRSYTESYENGRRFLQAVRPDVLGLDIAYMGYVATYFPYNKTLVSIVAPPPGPEGAAPAPAPESGASKADAGK